MATRISKPAFNIGQKLSELDLPVGTNGSQLLKSADAAESFVLTQAGRRNLVINGNPIIYQRGRTATDHGVYNYFTADRWRTSSNGSYTKTGQFDQEVVLDQSIPGIGGKVNYIKYTNTSAATGISGASWGMNYRIENKDVAPYLGKVMTLSCYMKSDEGIEIRSGFISGTTSSSIPLVAVGDPKTYVTLTPEWKRYTWTFTLGNTLPSTHMDIGLRIQVDKAGSVCYTCLQFEEGNVATPFEFRSYAEELALCERYCQKYGEGWWFTAYHRGAGYSEYGYGMLPHRTTMLKAPSVAAYGDNLHGYRYVPGGYRTAQLGSGRTESHIVLSGTGSTQMSSVRIQWQSGHGWSNDDIVHYMSQNEDTFLILSGEL